MKQQTTSRRTKGKWLRLFWAALCLPGFAVCGDEPAPILFGVFPYLPTARLEQVYAPVAADLSEAVGREVQLRTRPSFSKFREELKRQTYDLIFIQPFDYVEIAEPHGYRSIALPKIPLKAVFVVREDSAVRELSQLRSQTLANPPIKAAVTLLGRLTLLENHLTPGKDIHLSYQNSHAACLRQVLIRKAAACVTAPAPLRIFQTQSGIKFRRLTTSQSIPGSTYAVHQRLPAQLAKALQAHISDWDNNPRGQKLLQSIKLPGFLASDDAKYNPVREILKQVEEVPH